MSPRPPSFTPPARGNAASLWRRFTIPEHGLLTEARNMLRAAGQRSPDQRTPEDHARLAAFRVMDALMAFLNEYKARVEPGAKRWRIVERLHPTEPGRLLVEFVIEEVP